MNRFLTNLQVVHSKMDIKIALSGYNIHISDAASKTQRISRNLYVSQYSTCFGKLDDSAALKITYATNMCNPRQTTASKH